MRAYRFDHLADAELLRLLANLVAEGRENTARTVAVIAEVDRRELYVPAGYSSTMAYCVEKLGLSDDAALKRIQVARAARECPALLEWLADGRLHLTGARLVAPHLTRENSAELLDAAAYKTRLEIERLIAERFSSPDLLTVPVQAGGFEHAPGHVETESSPISSSNSGVVSEVEHAPGHVAATVTNLAPRRIPLNLLPSTHEKIRQAKELLGADLQSGDDALVVDRALAEMIRRLEKMKSRASRLPRGRKEGSPSNPRHVPKRVKRAVWNRDGGQCTFVGDTGHRCGTRSYLEFDHIEPVAKSGNSTVDNLRLRCRAHNQFEAERTFGEGFMAQKRLARKREVARPAVVAAAPRGEKTHQENAAADQDTQDILNGLRELGFRSAECRRAAEYSATLPASSLELRMRAALSFLRPKKSHRVH
jgi:5-methylcytosine-specific restriction endonuclease McrA